MSAHVWQEIRLLTVLESTLFQSNSEAIYELFPVSKAKERTQCVTCKSRHSWAAVVSFPAALEDNLTCKHQTQVCNSKLEKKS